MKRNILNKVFLILLALTAFSCRTRKLVPVVVASSTSTAKETINKTEVLRRLDSNQINFSTLLLKARADLNISNKSNPVSMNIRMQKGKMIWISVSAPIIGEVARTLITPDSIKIINKFENTYTRKPFNYIYQYTNDQINFETLQNIFIGDAVSGTLTQQSSIELKGGQSHVKGNLSGLAYLQIFDVNYHLVQTNLTDKQASQDLTVNYGDYKAASSQFLPNAISIKSTAASKNIGIDLQYTYVGLNEALDFPFSVPKRFTVKD